MAHLCSGLLFGAGPTRPAPRPPYLLMESYGLFLELLGITEHYNEFAGIIMNYYELARITLDEGQIGEKL